MINRTMTTECPLKGICKQRSEEETTCGEPTYIIETNYNKSPFYHRCKYFISAKNWILELIKEEVEK